MSVQIQMFVAQTPTATIIQAATAANATRVTVTMATTSQNASVRIIALILNACLGCSVHYAAAAKNLIEVNQCYFLFFAVNCLIIVLSLMWLCTEMDCDQFEPESDGDRTPKKVKCVLLLMIIIVRYTVRLIYIDLHWSSSS